MPSGAGPGGGVGSTWGTVALAAAAAAGVPVAAAEETKSGEGVFRHAAAVLQASPARAAMRAGRILVNARRIPRRRESPQEFHRKNRMAAPGRLRQYCS